VADGSFFSRSSGRNITRLPLRQDTFDDSTVDTSRSSCFAFKSQLRAQEIESNAYQHSINQGVGTKSCLPVPKLLSRRRKNRVPKQRSGTFQDQSEEMAHLLRSSLETSDDLRKRLASIGDYYERLCKDLETNLNASNAERKKKERELLNQIAALERSQGKPRSRPKESEDSKKWFYPAHGEV
jgi:hypothetical protein